MFRDLERVQDSFIGIAAHRIIGANLVLQRPDRVGARRAGLGQLLPGARPRRRPLGRLFTPDDDKTPGTSFLAVISHDYWRRRFQEDPGVVGQSLIVNGHAFTDHRRRPRGLRGHDARRPSRRLRADHHARPDAARAPGPGFENRRQYWAYLFGRLKPGVTIEQARVALNGPYRAIINDVEAPLQKGMSEQTMARFTSKTVTVEPGARGQSRSTARRARRC